MQGFYGFIASSKMQMVHDLNMWFIGKHVNYGYVNLFKWMTLYGI